jgi:hypothetical protein
MALPEEYSIELIQSLIVSSDTQEASQETTLDRSFFRKSIFIIIFLKNLFIFSVKWDQFDSGSLVEFFFRLFWARTLEINHFFQRLINLPCSRSNVQVITIKINFISNNLFLLEKKYFLYYISWCPYLLLILILYLTLIPWH